MATLHKNFLLLLLSLTYCIASYALPFTVTPKAGARLPQFIVLGTPTKALYTVTNQTGESRSNNFIKYLPPNTSQIIVDPTYPDLCTANFALNAFGKPGASCTLELSVTGLVNGNDPDPHNHLFSCLFDGISCAGTLTPLNISTILTPAIATGGYNGNNAPLFIKNPDGFNWISINPSAITLPIDYSSTTNGMGAVTCLNGKCLASGNYLTAAGVSKPLLLLSNNNGTTWTTANLALPADLATFPNSFSYLLSTSIANNTIVSVGTYGNSSNIIKLLIEVSNNQGISWSIPTVLLPPTATGNSTLDTVFYNGIYHLAAGFYNTVTQTVPLLLVSPDNGNTWHTAPIALPANFTNGSLSSVNCMNNNVCASVGQYNNVNSNSFSLIAITHNGGASWVQPSAIHIPATFGQEQSSFVTCTNHFCIDLGNSFSTSQGFILFSNADATVWNNASITFPNNNNALNSQLTSATCTNSFCIAIGNYYSISIFPVTFFPLILVSYDQGHSWSSAPITLPSDFMEDGSLSSVVCDTNDICTTVGSYQNTSAIETPLILTSTHGSAWAPPASLTLPNNFGGNGQLEGIANLN